MRYIHRVSHVPQPQLYRMAGYANIDVLYSCPLRLEIFEVHAEEICLLT